MCLPPTSSKELSMTNLLQVDWSELPPPHDDGGARHLDGAAVPSLSLPDTRGNAVDLSRLAGKAVVYAYPMTGRPDMSLSDGWDMIPGARGCTPQSCAFRDHYAELAALGVEHLFGLSTQDTSYQIEAANRLHLPFPLLSDARLEMAHALRLPTMDVAGTTLLKRLTLVIVDGRIAKAFYPVFPPDRSAADVMAWLEMEGQS
jgi:peroxiredoxin